MRAKIFLILNLLSLILIAIFFIFGYTFFLKKLYSEYFLIYQTKSKFFVGNLENLFKIGLSGIFVFFLNSLLGNLLRKYKKKEFYLTALVSFVYQIILLIFEIQVYFLNL